MSEIEDIIIAVKKTCPDIIVSQLTNFGEKPFESGVWKLWLENYEEFHINIEILYGIVYAVYSNREFKDKYPLAASKICDFFNEVRSLKIEKDTNK